MTFFGKFASVSIAALTFCASTPSLAGSELRPIHVQCDGETPTPLCEALGVALRGLHLGRSVIVSPDPSTGVRAHLTVRFEPTRQNPHALAGFLSWQDSSGHAGHGPEIELSVVDTGINDDMLADFARTLARHSGLPL